MKDIAIYGAGGFGREVACLINRINKENGVQWNLIGFFDDVHPAGDKNEYGTVLGNMSTLNSWEKPLSVAFGIGSPKAVSMLHSKIHNELIDFPNLISPDTIFLDKANVRMGNGNIICSRCLISCNTDIGNFNILNSYITVGHDCKIGDYNAVMPAARISGSVNIGNRNFIGVNAVILQYMSISDDTVIGASSVVLRNIKKQGTYVGNPAKKITY